MPLNFVVKPKASKPVSRMPVKPLSEEEVESALSGLDLSNRSIRTPIGWVSDASPSMTGFTEAQFQAARLMADELRKLPVVSRTVMMEIVQIGTPPLATGFAEIRDFRVPEMQPSRSTPLHSALVRVTADLGALFSEFRAHGIERTDSVVIITTDGYANDATEEQIQQSIKNFLDLGKKWSVTNLVVGVGRDLNKPLLMQLANSIPPIRIEELNAACLMPFIQKITEQVSQSRRGQRIELELPDGLTPIE